MAAWTLIPCLVELRGEFNALAPSRDKGADGSIGDSAHTSRSDHTPDEDSDYLRDHDGDSKNEVHALDTDSTGPWPPEGTPTLTQKQRFHRIIMRIVAGERRKWLSDTDRCRLKYVIWDRRIYSQGNDFQGEAYTGSDPHTNHAHFSGRYETACENDTRSWGVLPPAQEWSDMATEAEIKQAFREVLAETGIQDLLEGAAGRGVHNQPLGRSTVTIGQVLQPLQSVPATLSTLTAYASLEASEVPPTAQENAAAVVAALEPLPPVEPPAEG